MPQQHHSTATFTRRDILRYTGAAAATAMLPRIARGAEKGPKPNILVIMSDEHNASVTGCYGNSLIRTPNIDSIARRGITFENCYTNSPLCVPARMAFTSGKYCSRVGGWSNTCRLPSNDFPSIPIAMNAAGYESVLCGKMHYDATRRHGFTEIGGNMNNAHMTGLGERRAPDDLSLRPGMSVRFNDFHAGIGSSMRHDMRVVDGTIPFLARRKKTDKPFFMISGILTPHFPLTVPEEYWAAYRGKVAMPQMPPGFLETLPRNYKHLRIGFHIENATPEIINKGRELYYGLTQWMDEQVGKILKALADSEIADNTVVIYTTDHGENMGEHGLWWKNTMYEQAARIPLIVSWPARWAGGQRRVGACSLVDVVKTIAEIGGADVPSDWNGNSLCSWMDRPQTPWRDIAVSEYYAHNIASGYAMLRNGQYKYVYHTPADAKHPAERELYDLKADPGEFSNLASKPEQADRVKKMHEMLVKELGEDPDKTELHCRADYARGYGRS